MLTLHILHQDETPLLYSLVLGEGVVNDATSVVHFNVVQKIHVESIYGLTALRVFENFLQIFSVVTAIQKDEGRCYIGCFGWSKKLVREESFFTCVACNKTNVVAELRHRAILSVLDNTGTSAFLGFDTKVTKLTGIEASEAAQIVVDTDLPRSLADIVGSTYTFQLRLKDFNFTANHQTFTISLIFPAREFAPMPTFAEGVQVPEAVTPGSDARLANTCKVAEQETTSDVSLPGRLAVAKEQVVLERMPRRKHV
ncbi:BnaC02g47070D [Brassica napus]|uniref:BnaC02g47070D protein n=1 Tax=Brassica napus TaxID=3708 RepID=A0A078IWN6_BRANA|nr:BnaC02g47070D [Brassica napus]